VTFKALIGLIRASTLSAALFLAGGAIPFVGAIAMLFTPAPIISYAVSRPAAVWRVIGAVLLSAAGVLVAAGPFALLAYSVTFGIATAIICYMLERGARFEIIVAVTTAVVMAAGSLALLLAAGSPAVLLRDFRDGLSAAMARSDDLYRVVGMGAGLDADTRTKLVDMIVELGPALAVIAAAFAVLVNLSAFWRLVGKNRLPYRLFGDLVRWSTPEWLVWVLIASGFALFVPVATVRTVALDGFVCVAAVYFCQGLAVMAFYLKMIATPAAWRGVIYFIAAVQPLLAALVSAVGVFDLWIDFRRLRPPGQEAGTFSDLL
jgi:uncharacterized protein YybS (DUF2232 family)